MDVSRLLANVVAGRGLPPEPVATDVLAHVLDESRAARRVLEELMRTWCPSGTFGDLTFVGEDSPIGPAELDKAFGDRAVPGSRLLLRTDWNHHYGEPDYQARSPYIGPAGLDWIVARRPRLVSYDYSHSKDAPDAPTVLHAVRTYLSAGIVTMGYVTNLDQIDPALAVTL